MSVKLVWILESMSSLVVFLNPCHIQELMSQWPIMDLVINPTSQLLLPFCKEMTMRSNTHKEEKTSAKKVSMRMFTGLPTQILRPSTGREARSHLSQMDLTQNPSSSTNRMISPKKELMRTSTGSLTQTPRPSTGREAKMLSFQMDPTQNHSSSTKEQEVIFQRQE
jgi:hypothetical protein